MSAAIAGATTEIFTFKDGVLSAIAHDLRLHAPVATATWDAATRTLKMSWRVLDISVRCARIDGRDAPHLLSDADLAKIRTTMQKDVLKADRFPEIHATFIAPTDVDKRELPVELTLQGEKKIVLARMTSGDIWNAVARVHQPDFGIKPYSALFGTLKVRPDVEVHVRIPVGAIPS